MIIVNEEKIGFHIELYTQSIDQKVKDLAILGIRTDNQVIFIIHQHLYQFDRLNVYILFIACALFLDINYQNTIDYGLARDNIFNLYPHINEDKLNHEISVYLVKVTEAVKGGPTPYLLF